MSIKNPNDPIGNRTRELLSSSSVPEPNTPLQNLFMPTVTEFSCVDEVSSTQLNLEILNFQ
jgi:hypothetical protein